MHRSSPKAVARSDGTVETAEGSHPPVLRLIRDAQAAQGDEQTAFADQINLSLGEMPRLGGSRAAADLLIQQLESGALAGLVDSNGLSCRAAAVGALVDLGYPYALEVTPEDLEHLREQKRVARWATLGMGLVWPVSAVEVGLALTEHRWAQFAEWTGPVSSPAATSATLVHVGVTLAAASGAALTRAGTRARGLSLAALCCSSAMGVTLCGFYDFVPALLTGLAAGFTYFLAQRRA